MAKSSYDSSLGNRISTRYMRHWDDGYVYFHLDIYPVQLDTAGCSHSLPIGDLDGMLEINMSGTRKRRQL